MVQPIMSVVQNLEIVCYSGPAIALHNIIAMEISVGAYSKCYWVEVRYWECPSIESPLYLSESM